MYPIIDFDQLINKSGWINKILYHVDTVAKIKSIIHIGNYKNLLG